MVAMSDIDVKEAVLRKRGGLLDILLTDRTTKKNIIWATDSYEQRGVVFGTNKQIKTELVTGAYSKLIQPRAAKSLDEQRSRTKEKAEVFTPLKTVDQMNKLIDWSRDSKFPADSGWQEYVKELKLEISCGEAPFIVSRYNPTAHTGKLIKLGNRVGFLDRKLRVVSKHCDTQREWRHWALEAFKASYGYEWQGDNVLIARENLLYTLIDYYKAKFNKTPTLAVQQEFADVISWNIFQMDGIKYVVPMSCKHIDRVIPGDLTLFGELPDTIEKDECEGCKFNRPTKHNGKYVKIMEWSKAKPVKFLELSIKSQNCMEK